MTSAEAIAAGRNFVATRSGVAFSKRQIRKGMSSANVPAARESDFRYGMGQELQTRWSHGLRKKKDIRSDAWRRAAGDRLTYKRLLKEAGLR